MQRNKFYFKCYIFLFFLISVKIYAQNESSAIGLISGYAQDGFGVNLNYNYYIDKWKYIQGGIYYSSNKINKGDIKIPFNIFTFNAGYFFSIYKSRRNTLAFNLGGGGLVGYEIINNGNNTLNNGGIILDESKFLYGLFLGTEIDIYVSNTFSFIIKANQYFHPSSDLGKLTPFAGVGFRLFLF